MYSSTPCARLSGVLRFNASRAGVGSLQNRTGTSLRSASTSSVTSRPPRLATSCTIFETSVGWPPHRSYVPEVSGRSRAFSSAETTSVTYRGSTSEWPARYTHASWFHRPSSLERSCFVALTPTSLAKLGKLASPWKMASTSCPCSARARTACLPTKPLAPATTIFIRGGILRPSFLFIVGRARVHPLCSTARFRVRNPFPREPSACRPASDEAGPDHRRPRGDRLSPGSLPALPRLRG